jgi:GT2 family glycosyltransferase
MNNPHPNLAIIVVSYNTCDMLRACLRSVYAGLAHFPADAQVWVVDNASTDGSPDIVRAEFPQAQLMALEKNLGFAAGNNTALRELGFGTATGHRPRDILFLNPDTQVQGNALAQMASELRKREKSGVVGASLVYPDGRFQHSAFRFPTLWQIWFDFFPRPARLPLRDSSAFSYRSSPGCGHDDARRSHSADWFDGREVLYVRRGD